MKVTPDRLAVAAAIRDEYLRHWVEPELREAAGSLKLESVIEPLPEPDVQATDKLAGNSGAQAQIDEWGHKRCLATNENHVPCLRSDDWGGLLQTQIDAAVAKEREGWRAAHENMKAALARPCISCGYKPKQIRAAKEER